MTLFQAIGAVFICFIIASCIAGFVIGISNEDLEKYGQYKFQRLAMYPAFKIGRMLRR